MKKLTEWITNHSVLLVVLSLILLIPAWIGYQNTKINYDILTYLPEDIETIQGEKILTEDFKVGAFSFVIVDNMKANDILTLEEEIRSIQGVSTVASITDLTDILIPIEMIPDEIKDKVYQDGKTIILVTLEGSTSEELTISAIEKLRETVEDKAKVSGMTAMVLDTRNLSEQEIFAYIVIAVIFCLMVLFLATDSYLVPFFLLGNIGVAILYNMGTNLFLGQISYITKAITAVLQLGVTMDFSIFLYHKYNQAKAKEKNKKKAMSLALQDTFTSVIGSSLTTIAGFLALCSMNLTLGRDIGIVMAKGVLFGLLCVMTLFPALLLVFDNAIEKTKHKNFLPKFEKVQQFVIKHNKLILILFLLLLVPALYGNRNVDVYYKLDKSLPENLASSIANKELQETFHIISPEMILMDKEIKEEKLDSLIEELENLEGIDFVIAPSKIREIGIPLDFLPEKIETLIQNGDRQLILVNSTYEIASKELNSQVEQLQKIVKSYDEKAIVAGEGPLMRDLTTIADHDFKMVNYVSIIVILILMAIVLKSISLPVILIIAIEFAICTNMAISFYGGVELPFIASIVIGTIQLGATIDYAILMSTKYLEERRKEKEKTKAISNTLSQTVPSIITSGLCFFAATFAVAIYSKIDMIASICNLLSRGAIISMLVVILILPTLLLLFDKQIQKTTKSQKGVCQYE